MLDFDQRDKILHTAVGHVNRAEPQAGVCGC